MLPALPTGTRWQSGARPRTSQTSKARLFCPSSRSGFTEFTSVTGWASASSLVTARAPSKPPSTSRTRAPATRVWASFPRATPPRGTRTAHVSPARAAYAAAEALVFPVEAHTTALAPSSRALETATVIPRSLKEPVGLVPSYFRYTSQPVSADRASDRTSGVPPSRRVTSGVALDTGSRSRYSAITPRHGLAISSPRLGGRSLHPRDPHHAPDLGHDLQVAEVGHRGLEGGLVGPVGDHDQEGLVPEPFLPHAGDGDLVTPEGVRHLGQHAGAVDHVEQEVVLALHGVHGPQGPVRVARTAHDPCPGDQVAGHIDRVAHDGRGGRRGPRAPAVENPPAPP